MEYTLPAIYSTTLGAITHKFYFSLWMDLVEPHQNNGCSNFTRNNVHLPLAEFGHFDFRSLSQFVEWVFVGIPLLSALSHNGCRLYASMCIFCQRNSWYKIYFRLITNATIWAVFVRSNGNSNTWETFTLLIYVVIDNNIEIREPTPLNTGFLFTYIVWFAKVFSKVSYSHSFWRFMSKIVFDESINNFRHEASKIRENKQHVENDFNVEIAKNGFRICTCNWIFKQQFILNNKNDTV